MAGPLGTPLGLAPREFPPWGRRVLLGVGDPLEVLAVSRVCGGRGLAPRSLPTLSGPRDPARLLLGVASGRARA